MLHGSTCKVTTAKAVSVWVSYTSSSYGSSPRWEIFLKEQQTKQNQGWKQGLNRKKASKIHWANIWQYIFKLSLVTLGLRVWVEVECKPWRNPFPASYLQGNVSVQSFLLCSGQQGISSPSQGQEGLCKRLLDRILIVPLITAVVDQSLHSVGPETCWTLLFKGAWVSEELCSQNIPRNYAWFLIHAFVEILP